MYLLRVVKSLVGSFLPKLIPKENTDWKSIIKIDSIINIKLDIRIHSKKLKDLIKTIQNLNLIKINTLYINPLGIISYLVLNNKEFKRICIKRGNSNS